MTVDRVVQRRSSARRPAAWSAWSSATIAIGQPDCERAPARPPFTARPAPPAPPTQRSHSPSRSGSAVTDGTIPPAALALHAVRPLDIDRRRSVAGRARPTQSTCRDDEQHRQVCLVLRAAAPGRRPTRVTLHDARRASVPITLSLRCASSAAFTASRTREQPLPVGRRCSASTHDVQQLAPGTPRGAPSRARCAGQVPSTTPRP